MTTTTVERRFTSLQVQLRAGTAPNTGPDTDPTSDTDSEPDSNPPTTSNSRTIGGYAALFNSPSQNLGGFREQIEPGAFNRAASRNWPGMGVGVQARYNHDDNMLLGTTGAGTLRLAVDERGLAYDVDVPQSRSDVLELVQRGDVRSSSFAFVADDDDWSTDLSGFPLRTLRQIQLLDVAPVNSPAYLDTSAGLRSLAARFSADPEEVRAMAERNELMKFFKRTDQTPVPTPASKPFTLADGMKYLR